MLHGSSWSYIWTARLQYFVRYKTMNFNMTNKTFFVSICLLNRLIHFWINWTSTNNYILYKWHTRVHFKNLLCTNNCTATSINNNCYIRAEAEKKETQSALYRRNNRRTAGCNIYQYPNLIANHFYCLIFLPNFPIVMNIHGLYRWWLIVAEIDTYVNISCMLIWEFQC